MNESEGSTTRTLPASPMRSASGHDPDESAATRSVTISERPLHDYEPEAARAVASALTGRRAPAVVSGFVGAR